MTSLNSKDRNNYNNTMDHSHSHLIKLIYFKVHAQYSQECGFMGSWEPMDFQRVPWYHLELLKHRIWNLRIKIPHYAPNVSQERKFLEIFHRLKNLTFEWEKYHIGRGCSNFKFTIREMYFNPGYTGRMTERWGLGRALRSSTLVK